MAAVVNSEQALAERKCLVPKDIMVPVPAELRPFLYRAFGVEPHMMAYFCREDPNRIYIEAYGRLHFIDLSVVSQISIPTKGIMENLSLKASELARNDSNVWDDLEGELSKVLDRVLSKFSEKHGRNAVAIAPEFPRSVVASSWHSLSDMEREEIQRERRKKRAYKTSLCKAFRQNRTCEYGSQCSFAHGENELRLPPQAHPKYKTQLCNKFSLWNYCPYGARCQYIHRRVNEFPKVRRSPGNVRGSLICGTTASLKLMGPMNTNAICQNSPVPALTNSSFTEQEDFGTSHTNSGKARNHRSSVEEAHSSCGNGSYNFKEHKGIGGRENQLAHYDEKSLMDQINNHLLNVSLEDNASMFSKSCFPRIAVANTNWPD